MDDIILKIEHISKKYVLGQIGGTTLREELQRLNARIHHREDPTKKIGSRDYTTGETFLALNDVSFEVNRGERIGIIGHNGAGKSTLLKLLSRITAPTSGTIGLNGRIASMLEVGTGFHPELTGRENIYMNGAILGMKKKEIDAKIEDIIEFSECRQFIDTPVKRYSSGMYVKLAFSVAAHLDSEIMIMDEVLAVGDMAFQKKCLTKMSDVSKSDGRTILYVSHNMNTIRQLCDRILVLDHGVLVFDGSVEEGIGIYINNNIDPRTMYDYSDYKRSSTEKRTLEMIRLEITSHPRNQLPCGDNLGFILHCIAHEAVNNIGYRLEVFFADGSIVGTSFLDSCLSAKKNDSLDLSITFSTRNLAPGKYQCAGLLYETDRLGNQVPLDRVFPALSFEIIPIMNDSIIWLHQWWGHVVLDNMNLISVK